MRSRNTLMCILVLSTGILGCRWNDDFRALQPAQMGPHDKKATSNLDSQDYVNLETHDNIAQPKFLDPVPEIDGLSKIPEIQD